MWRIIHQLRLQKVARFFLFPFTATFQLYSSTHKYQSVFSSIIIIILFFPFTIRDIYGQFTCSLYCAQWDEPLVCVCNKVLVNWFIHVRKKRPLSSVACPYVCNGESIHIAIEHYCPFLLYTVQYWSQPKPIWAQKMHDPPSPQGQPNYQFAASVILFVVCVCYVQYLKTAISLVWRQFDSIEFNLSSFGRV